MNNAFIHPLSGDMGIGTITPLAKLHVEGNIYTSGLITASNIRVIGDYVKMDTITSNTEQMVITNDGTGPALKVTQTGANSIAEFYDGDGGAGGILALKIANNGLVGIGTSDPSVALDVIGTVKASSFIGNGSQLTGIIASKWSNTSTNLYVVGSNVGIGTATPRSQLEVAGHIWPSSNVAYDLGSTNLRFRDLYLSGNTIDLGGTRLSRNEETGGLSVVNPLNNAPADTNVGNLVVASNVNIGGNVGVGTTNPQAKLQVVGTVKATSFSGDGSLLTGIVASRWSQSGSNVYVIGSNVGIGTTNPLSTLHVNGTAQATTFSGSGASLTALPATSLTGTVSVTNGGTGVATITANKLLVGNGTSAVLQPTNLHWDNTNSRLGVGTASPVQALDVIGTVKATSFVGDGSLLTGVVASQWSQNGSNVYVIGSNVGIGTTNPQKPLDIVGDFQATSAFSSSVSYSYDHVWTTRTSAADNGWHCVTWASELAIFVAVAYSGQVMTSPDGITWTLRTSAANNAWISVVWARELLLFVAVAQSGIGNRVMTSSDGITWTSRTSPIDNEWRSVTWAPELPLFVAVAQTGSGNRAMSSPDGITWTARASAVDYAWLSVVWAPTLRLFAAVAYTGQIMTSPNGINWTSRTSPASNAWNSVTWAHELSLFVAVAQSGSGNRVMTSSDGISWTARTSAVDNGWASVTWSPELYLFVAVANSGTSNRVMTSPDGIAWSARTSATANSWLSLTWAPMLSIFVAVAHTGTGDRVMTSSAIKGTITIPGKTLQWKQGNLGINTASPSNALHVVGSIKATSNIVSDAQFLGQQLDSATTPSFSFIANSNTGIFQPASSNIAISTGGIERFRVVASGSVGIGTTNPLSTLHVNGTAQATTFSGSGASLTALPAASLTGTVSVANGGTGVATITANKVLVGNGTSAVLQPTNLHWDNTNSRLGVGTASPVQALDVIGTVKATSFVGDGSLLTGITSSGSGSGTSQWSQSGSNVYIVGSNVGIGTTNPQKPLDIVGDFQAMSVYQNNISYTYDHLWNTRTSAADNNWRSVVWAPELSIFVAVAESGVGNRVMTSTDGINWIVRASASDNNWHSVTWAAELSLFVAVANTGTGNRVMTSSNGITWTTRVSAADNYWTSVTWAPELLLFVAVALSGVGNRVMTSPDGITWTVRVSAADNYWLSVTWAPQLSTFVAVAVTGTGNRVMTSTNGINWTSRTSAADNNWLSVTWAPELSIFVAVADTGSGNRVMTSPDGIAWIARTSAADNGWTSVTWAPELSLFVAVSDTGTGNRVMTSPDGITWTARTSAANNQWFSIKWAPELSIFVAVSVTGTGNRVMTSSAIKTTTTIPSKMLQWNQGNFGINTASPSNALHVVGDTRIEGNLTVDSLSFNVLSGTTTIVTSPNGNGSVTGQLIITNDGTGPALIVNQTGTQPILEVQDDGVPVLKIIDGGNVGVGTTNPQSKLHVIGTAQATTFSGSGASLTALPAASLTGAVSVANGGTGVATITANKVLVGNGTSSILQPTNLHWDNTNSRLGVGTASPVQALEVIGSVKATSFVGDGSQLTNLTAPTYYHSARIFNVSTPVFNYNIQDVSGDNPTIYVYSGQTYGFALNVSGHPFVIRASNGGANLTIGFVHVAPNGTQTNGNNGCTDGTLYWTVPYTQTTDVVYQCANHSSMVGTIVVMLETNAGTTGGGESLWSSSSSNLYVVGSNVGIGTTNPQKQLDIVGDFQATSIYQSSVSYSYDHVWTSRTSAADNNWRSVCWAPELSLFVAVAESGSGKVMTSTDGITWTARTSANENSWFSVTWAPQLSLFVAVAISGTGNRVMTSPNGISWTARASVADNNWHSVTWAPQLSLFVAVAFTGTGNRVMTSPDGITWTIRTSAADNQWISVVWAPQLSIFVATADTGSGNRVMTSPDGINWTIRASAANNWWRSVTWSPKLFLFVAVSTEGTGNRVMTSPDGITWTSRTSAADNNWSSVTWAPELSIFVAVALSGTGNRVMTSPDGITWTARISAANNFWESITWSPTLSIFVAVGSSGTGNRVMTSSAIQTTTTIPSKTLQWSQGNFGINTTTPTNALHVVGDTRIEGNLTVNGTQTIVNTNVGTTEQLIITNNGTGPALVVNQTGTQPIVEVQDDGVPVLKIIDGGNVGVGTTNPQSKLHVIGTAQATTFSGSGASLTALPAASLTGAVSVANGGTGVATITANKVLVGNGTSSILQPTNLHWDNTNSRLGVGTASPIQALEVIGSVKATSFVGDGSQLTNLTAPTYYHSARIFNVSTPVFNYNIQDVSGDNPTIYVYSGQTYGFALNVSGHPFVIRASNGGANLSTGFLHVAPNGTQTNGNNGYTDGTLYWTVPYTQTTDVVYQCANHSSMVGTIVVLMDTNVGTTEQLVITNDGTGPALVVNQTGAQPVLDVQDDGVSVLKIIDGGNVGIGTTIPQAKLHVYGDITITSTGALTIPSGTTGQRPTNPTAGMIRYNNTEGFVETYDAIFNRWVSISTVFGVLAAGGSITEVIVSGFQYRVHTFTSVGTSSFQVLRGGEVEYLIVAGGGSGGTRDNTVGAGGGGGGAGGLLTGSINVSAATFNIVIGTGGAIQTINSSMGIQGGNSSALGVTAIGGGAGGAYKEGNGGNGGSGGGGGRDAVTAGGVGIAGPPQQGFNGGAGGTNPIGSGGGGGAGEVGKPGTSVGGLGGNGITNTIAGNSVTYGGGGGGASFDGQLTNNGGAGGGGRGGSESPYVLPVSGTNGLGGGGGGGNNPSGAGGSGIIVIRYRIG